jgi:hypothetical protein
MSEAEDHGTGHNLETVANDEAGERPPLVGGNDGITRREFITSVGAATAAVAIAGVSKPERAEAADASNPIYRIHPAIGIARLGNLDPDLGYIIGPEIPGQGPIDGLTGETVVQYKDSGLIKRQAARFRIWEYEYDSNGRLNPIGEVLPQTPTPGKPKPYVKSITWTVHLANRKASFYEEDGPHGEVAPARGLRNPAESNRATLESDFGPRSISGALAVPQAFTPSSANGYPLRQVTGADNLPVIDYLGELRTDDAGRLLLFGGKGHSGSSLSPSQPLTHWSNNNYWFDDISDGPVTAVVTIDDGHGHQTNIPVDPAGHAWVLVAPPDYSPGLNASVSLYDVLYDMAVRELPIPDNTLYHGGPLDRLRILNERWDIWENDPSSTGGFEFGSFEPDYQTEIWPIVLNAVNYVYTTGLVNFKHSNMLSDPLGDPGPDAAHDREVFFSYVRPPEGADTLGNGPATMPLLYGDNWYIGNENFSSTFGQNGNGNPDSFVEHGPRAVPKYVRYSTLTPTQYGLLRSWSAGNFIPPPGSIAAEADITPHGLDRANLENCIGGPFYPGIECGWQIRNPVLFIEPFRINHAATSQYVKPDGNLEATPIGPGHFSRQMALPWQADFNDCSKVGNLGWWPSARADDVFLHVEDRLNERVPWARPDDRWPSGSTTASYEDMVANWYKFGFILEGSDVGGHYFYIEKERNEEVP